MEKELNIFIKDHINKIKPLRLKETKSYWYAAVTGVKKAYDRVSKYELMIKNIYNSRLEFNFLKKCIKSENIKDEKLKRQNFILYNKYLKNQVDKDLLLKAVKLSNEAQRKFNTFIPKICNKEVTDNELKEILKKEKNNDIREKAWDAGKNIGEYVADDIINLVILRNKIASKLGFDNYHSFYLSLNEQNTDDIDKIFHDLYLSTENIFKKIKYKIDKKICDTYNIKEKDIMPWHYHDPFFQEVPAVFDFNLDEYYLNYDIKKIAVNFFNSIGLDVNSIIKKSDLYEKKGKYPSAFCINIDHKGDIRILCNLKNNEYWMETILHELGHAVYYKYIDNNLPFLLKEPAHIFTTEAIAMLFGRLSKDSLWIKNMLNLSNNEFIRISTGCKKYLTFSKIIFTRWVFVMYYFEKELYKNPFQDLNRLWWDLVERYQHIKMPKKRNKPDWASKIHFNTAPCYYHNYLLGELLASQINCFIKKNILGKNNIYNKDTGIYLIDNIFNPGLLYNWNEMIKNATGEYLKVKYFNNDFINNDYIK